MTTWPIELPSALINTYNEGVQNNILRSQTDKGPAKLRRRTTANVYNMSFMMTLTPAQVDILEDFYYDDIFSGALQFDFVHPRTGITVQARFVEPYSLQDIDGLYYKVGISLEILP